MACERLCALMTRPIIYVLVYPDESLAGVRGRWYRPSVHGIEAAPQYSASADYVRSYVNEVREKEGFGGERC